MNNVIIPKGSTSASVILTWTVFSTLAGLVLEVSAVLYPAWRDMNIKNDNRKDVGLTYQLSKRGWEVCYELTLLQPGDTCSHLNYLR